MYDFAKWKPITPAQYVEVLAEIAQDEHYGDNLKSEVQLLDGGNAYRIVFHAHVKTSPFESSVEPYLAILSSDGQNLCFKRTDVYLA